MSLINMGVVGGLIGLVRWFVRSRCGRKKAIASEWSRFGGKYDRPAEQTIHHLEAKSGQIWRRPFR
jgi:hypothetical protein